MAEEEQETKPNANAAPEPGKEGEEYIKLRYVVSPLRFQSPFLSFAFYLALE